jgi:hypothetical protein
MNWFTKSYVSGNSLKRKEELVTEWGWLRARRSRSVGYGCRCLRKRQFWSGGVLHV